MAIKISLIIPVRDEENSVDRLLKSISAQVRPLDEIIFVDAGSLDGTKAAIERNSGPGFDMKVMQIGAANPGIARNAGVERARFDFIAFADAGTELDRGWLKELGAVMENNENLDVVYGHYTPRVDTIFRECLAIAMMQPLSVVGGRRIRIRSIASSLIKRSVWRKAGGFPDMRAGEDRVFMERIDQDGFKVGYSPGAVMIWDIPQDLKGVFKRFSSYSYHNAKTKRLKGWHIPVLRMYAAALAMTMLGLMASPVFFAALFLMLGARVGRKIFSARHEEYFRTYHIPAYLAITGFLIVFIDAAMFAGWVRSRKPGAGS